MGFAEQLWRYGFRPGRLSPTVQVGLVVVGILTAAVALRPFARVLGPAEYVLVYLFIVAISAFTFGLVPALLATWFSTAAIVLFYLSYWIGHAASGAVVILTFIAVASVLCLQTARLQRRKREADDSAERARFLADLSIELGNWEFTRELSARMAREILSASGASGFVVYRCREDGDIEIRFVSEELSESEEDILRHARFALNEWKDCWHIEGEGEDAEAVEPHFLSFDDGSVILPLCSFDRLEGLYYLARRRDGRPFRDDHLSLVFAVARLLATRYEAIRLSALDARREAIRGSEELRTTLVSAVSHELKSPLTAMKAVVEDLKSQRHAGSRLEDEELGLLEDGIDRLQASVGGLLDVTLMDLSQWQAAMERIEIGDLIGTVLFNLSPEQRQRVVLDVPGELPDVIGDPVQLVRVVDNVLQNALAYSPAPLPVTVGASEAGSDMIVWVEDSGPGVCEGEEESIFERCIRGSASAAASGTGLGLTVAREIARYHGGDLTLAKKDGPGARFELRLPRFQRTKGTLSDQRGPGDPATTRR